MGCQGAEPCPALFLGDCTIAVYFWARHLPFLSLFPYLLKKYNEAPRACFVSLVGAHMMQCRCESFENKVKHQKRVFSVWLRDVGLSFPFVKEAAAGADDIHHEYSSVLEAGVLNPRFPVASWWRPLLGFLYAPLLLS